jgi:hypothetical protein
LFARAATSQRRPDLRKLIIAATALAFAAPAFAQPAYVDPRDRELIESLPHPYEVEEMGDRLGHAVGAIVEVPVGGVINAIDPYARAHPDTSIADVAGRDDPYFRERMQDQVAGISLKMADMVRGMAVAAPALRRSLDEIERSLGRAFDGYDYRR